MKTNDRLERSDGSIDMIEVVFDEVVEEKTVVLEAFLSHLFADSLSSFGVSTPYRKDLSIGQGGGEGVEEFLNERNLAKILEVEHSSRL